MRSRQIAVYTAAQVRELDRIAIEEQGIPGIVLMKRAGRAALDALLECWPQPEKITVFCGAGNNGGDGYVVAALASEKSLPVSVVYLSDPQKLRGDARRAWAYAEAEGVPMVPFTREMSPAGGVVVDAMLGTGLAGDVRPHYAEAIEWINASSLPVVAVDIPSGLCSDTGVVLGAAVTADLTMSFIGRKRGLFTGAGPAFAGEVMFDDLGVPEAVYDGINPDAEILNLESQLGALAPRRADAHKGLFGHVMIIGGDRGFGGAAAMAAEAALRCGAGLVSVATRAEHVAPILARTPEAMVVGVASGQELEPLLERPSVLVVGPGLGRSPWSEQMLQKAARSGKPLVVDADALNILAEGRVAADVDMGNWVLTPHPGEAARLLATTSGTVQADRFGSLDRLWQKYRCALLLKGAGTLTCGTGSLPVGICIEGNPGMASGGMGDVLSGVIGALMAQGLPPTAAIRLGVCLHASAADRAVEQSGQRGLRATDLMPWLHSLVNAQ